MKKFKTSSGKINEYKNVKNANGITGFLITSVNSIGNPCLVFRVYDKINLTPAGNWTFHDYSIFHSDLEVKILDKASFYHTKDNKIYLDYSPKALGMKEIF